MNELLLMKLIDMALSAVSVGLEHDSVVAKVKELEAKGATAEEITRALKKMRDDAIDAAQKGIDLANPPL